MCVNLQSFRYEEHRSTIFLKVEKVKTKGRNREGSKSFMLGPRPNPSCVYSRLAIMQRVVSVPKGRDLEGLHFLNTSKGG